MCDYNLEWGNMNTRQNSQAILDYDLLAPVSFLGIGFYFSWVYASFFGTSFFVGAASPMANASITTVISLAGLLSVFGASFFAYRVIDLFTKAPLYIVGSIVASVCTLTGFFGTGNAAIFYASSFLTGVGTALLLTFWGRLYGMVDGKQAGTRMALSVLFAVLLCLSVIGAPLEIRPIIVSTFPVLSACCLHFASKCIPVQAKKPEKKFIHFPLKLTAALFACGLTCGVVMRICMLSSETYLLAERALLLAQAGVGFLIIGMMTIRKANVDFDNMYWIILPLMGLGLLLLPILGSDNSIVTFTLVRAGYGLLDALVWVALSTVALQTGVDTARLFCGFRLALDSGVLCGNLIGYAIQGASSQHIAIVSAALVFLLMVVFTVAFNHKDVETIWGIMANSKAEMSRWNAACAKIAEDYDLTNREHEVMVLIAQGRSANYIADEFGVSASTIQTHSKHLYKKLDIHSRQNLISLIEDVRKKL